MHTLEKILDILFKSAVTYRPGLSNRVPTDQANQVSSMAAQWLV